MAEIYKKGSKLEKKNRSKYFDYKEKAIFFNNKEKDLLIQAFDYVDELVHLGEKERILNVAKFLERPYPGTLEFLSIFTDYKEEDQKHKVDRENIFKGKLLEEYQNSFKDWQFFYGWLLHRYKEYQIKENSYNGEHMQSFLDQKLSEGEFKGSESSTSYKGQMLDGFPCGQGQFKEGDETFTGNFKDGRIYGVGKWEKELLKESYEGEFKAGKKDGNGKYMKKNRVYEGEWTDNEFNGKGNLTVPGWVVMECRFHYGLRHGEGTLTKLRGKTNSKLTINFEFGQMLGEGTLALSSGKEVKVHCDQNNNNQYKILTEDLSAEEAKLVNDEMKWFIKN